MTTHVYKPSPSLRPKWFDPCIAMRPQSGSTMALVTQKGVNDPFDDVVLKFRGKTLSAKAAHPEINVGQLVNVFEWPAGVFWATCLQPSWYLQPLEDLIKAGRKSQAAVNYLLRKNPKYWPALIRLDKRGQPTDDDGTGGTGSADDGSKVEHDGFNDWDGDNGMSLAEWIKAGHDAADFADADANGDGKVSREEYADWLEGENGDEWYQRKGAFPFDPKDYRNSWFYFIETSSPPPSIGHSCIFTRPAGQRTSYPYSSGTYYANATASIWQPFYGITFALVGGTSQTLASVTRDFIWGTFGGPDDLDYVAFQGEGGLASSVTWPVDPAPGEMEAAVEDWEETKAAGNASASAGAASTNAKNPVCVICNKGRYSSHPLTFSAAFELGSGAPIGADEMFVAYSRASSISV